MKEKEKGRERDGHGVEDAGEAVQIWDRECLSGGLEQAFVTDSSLVRNPVFRTEIVTNADLFRDGHYQQERQIKREKGAAGIWPILHALREGVMGFDRTPGGCWANEGSSLPTGPARFNTDTAARTVERAASGVTAQSTLLRRR
ncbi:uncharacterized protein CIMG_12870 [Coccidioides immitis RS]|uniref:Uncharacterized protein n=1 Tax=Coccidioides immitis (strain RS) TaxID=246410 RepID=A0A0D8JSP4_COCIM|nr:uncharacterized protein CIMG_12870 [Coccidioides immitis RS]KJF60307.1 hypothetical protein CIMG_12870 [Coccidioides immitis RS]